MADPSVENVEFDPMETPPDDPMAVMTRQPTRSMQRVQTEYVTAIAVQVPRDIKAFKAEMILEGEYGGQVNYYNWMQSGKELEGLTVYGAMALARAWGNCLIPPPIVTQITESMVEVLGTFVDLEKGFSVSRPYRCTLASAKGKYANDVEQSERWDAGQFGTAISKALRNVILAGIPRWAQKKLLETSKEAVALGITEDGIDERMSAFLNEMSRIMGVPADAIEPAVAAKIGCSTSAATSKHISMLDSMAIEIESNPDRWKWAIWFFPEMKHVRDAAEGPDTDDVIRHNAKPAAPAAPVAAQKPAPAESQPAPVMDDTQEPGTDDDCCKGCGTTTAAVLGFECPECMREGCSECMPKGEQSPCPECMKKAETPARRRAAASKKAETRDTLL